LAESGAMRLTKWEEIRRLLVKFPVIYYTSTYDYDSCFFYFVTEAYFDIDIIKNMFCQKEVVQRIPFEYTLALLPKELDNL
jgi:hypothetical protein